MSMTSNQSSLLSQKPSLLSGTVSTSPMVSDYQALTREQVFSNLFGFRVFLNLNNNHNRMSQWLSNSKCSANHSS